MMQNALVQINKSNDLRSARSFIVYQWRVYRRQVKATDSTHFKADSSLSQMDAADERYSIEDDCVKRDTDGTV